MYKKDLLSVTPSDLQPLNPKGVKSVKAKMGYCAPQLFVVGKTVDLLQGGFGGYYDCPPDGYSSQNCW